MTRINRYARRCGRWMSLTALTLAVWLAPVVAWAETAAPNPNLKKAPPAWMGMALMFFMLIFVLGASLLPSKRGHQD